MKLYLDACSSIKGIENKNLSGDLRDLKEAITKNMVEDIVCIR